MSSARHGARVLRAAMAAAEAGRGLAGALEAAEAAVSAQRLEDANRRRHQTPEARVARLWASLHDSVCDQAGHCVEHESPDEVADQLRDAWEDRTERAAGLATA